MIVCIFCDFDSSITATATLILAFATVFIGWAAYRQYEKSTEIKSTELLISMYEKFYGNNSLKEIREWIDAKPVKSAEDFKSKNSDGKFEEKFTDYLNFFQLLIVLKNSGQIKEEQMKQMFNYYFRLLNSTKFIIEDYLENNGYNVLRTFLSQYKDDK